MSKEKKSLNSDLVELCVNEYAESKVEKKKKKKK